MTFLEMSNSSFIEKSFALFFENLCFYLEKLINLYNCFMVKNNSKYYYFNVLELVFDFYHL